jgi:hypothetical protein
MDKDLQELEYREREFNEQKTKDHLDEREKFMTENNDKKAYYEKQIARCKEIERNNKEINTAIESLKRELQEKRDYLKKEEVDLKEKVALIEKEYK